MYIQELIARLEDIRLQHGNLVVEVSDGDYIAPATDLGTPKDAENGGRTLVINGQFAHMFNEYESALRDIIEATAAYHQYDTAGRPWLKAALEVLPDNRVDHLAQVNSNHPDTRPAQELAAFSANTFTIQPFSALERSIELDNAAKPGDEYDDPVWGKVRVPKD